MNVSNDRYRVKKPIVLETRVKHGKKVRDATLFFLRVALINFLPETWSVLFLREEKRPSQDVKSSAGGRKRARQRERRTPSLCTTVRGKGEDPEKWTTSNLRPTS